MGESRTELLAWVNDLLQVNYTKVEQAGTGAAYCQIMDSIFNDVQMSKVKFDTKHEYEYVTNYKALQSSFDKHKIDKVIPVDKLLKCKFQDNLEFMQWMKRYWDQFFPGGEYDALLRRKGGSAKSPAGRAVKKAAAGKSPGVRPANTAARTRTSESGGDKSRQQITELKVTVDGLEKERDFYFGKLREIEILVQEQLEIAGHATSEEIECIREIQSILYRTEEGFEVPPEEEEEAEGLDYEETF
ncbi:calponin homology domain-containing protein [Sporodiniella umbellata]|nr:calponin homology domain-containing protein [Sporodiniella umbellata]